MKTFFKILASGALALGTPGTTALAADATTSFADPGAVRCQVCGSQYRVKTSVSKDNSIHLKLVPMTGTSKEKTH
jgi:hypothetical protein